MEDKRKKIAEFAEFLNSEVMETIDQNISFDEINHLSNVIVLQSTAAWIVEKVVLQLLVTNSDMKLFIVGRDDCKYLQEKYEKNIIWVEHNKSFADDDIENIKKIVNEKNVDALLFFNSFVNCVDFSNVEHVAMFVEDKVPIFSYSYAQGELNRHKNTAKHIYGEILYKDMLEWYKTIR